MNFLVILSLSFEDTPNGGSSIPSRISLCLLAPTDCFSVSDRFSKTSLPSRISSKATSTSLFSTKRAYRRSARRLSQVFILFFIKVAMKRWRSLVVALLQSFCWRVFSRNRSNSFTILMFISIVFLSSFLSTHTPSKPFSSNSLPSLAGSVIILILNSWQWPEPSACIPGITIAVAIIVAKIGIRKFCKCPSA